MNATSECLTQVEIDRRRFNIHLDACRQYSIADCDAALRTGFPSQEDRARLNNWKSTAERFARDHDTCVAGSSDACSAAIESPAANATKREMLIRLREQSSVVHRVKGHATVILAGALKRAEDLYSAMRDLPTSTHFSMLVAFSLGLALLVVVTRSRSSARELLTRTEFHSPPLTRDTQHSELPSASAAPDLVGPGLVAPNDGRGQSTSETRAFPSVPLPPLQSPAEETTMPTVDMQSRNERYIPSVTIKGASIHGTYATARNIAGLFGFFGWVLVGAGGFVALAGLSAPAPFNMVGAALGIGVAALGMLQVAAQQMLRAAVDSADYSRQSFLLQIGLAEGRGEIDLRRQ